MSVMYFKCLPASISLCNQTPSNLATSTLSLLLPIPSGIDNCWDLVYEIRSPSSWPGLQLIYYVKTTIMWLNSSDISTSVLSGTNNEASSAYLVKLLSSPTGFRSLMKTRNNMGPMPEPWTIERLITRVNYLRSPSFVNWSLSVKNETWPQH